MEVVEREHIDMVVISTHGISGWHPFVFGSIAEKVVKLAQCPLLLLRSAKPRGDLKSRSGRASEWWSKHIVEVVNHECNDRYRTRTI
jgi:hypothetical protein